MLTLLIALAVNMLTAPARADGPDQVDNGSFRRCPAHEDGGSAGNQDSIVVPGLQFAAPDYAGPGCPSGSVSSALSPDQRTLTVLFDAYTLQSGSGQSSSGQALARTSCSLRIPVTIPPGYRVQVTKIDYRGFASVPAGARATFNAGLAYVGEFERGPHGGPDRHRMRFNRGAQLIGPTQDSFLLTSQLAGPPWSPCGGSLTLESDSVLTLETTAPTQQATATIDSLDAASLPVNFSLRWQRCGQGPGEGHGNGRDDSRGEGRGDGRGDRGPGPGRENPHDRGRW